MFCIIYMNFESTKNVFKSKNFIKLRCKCFQSISLTFCTFLAHYIKNTHQIVLLFVFIQTTVQTREEIKYLICNILSKKMMLSCTSAGGLCDTDQLPRQLTGQHYCLKLKYLHFLQPNIQPYVSDLPIHVWNKWMTLCFAENFYFYWSRNLWSATDYREKAKSYIYVTSIRMSQFCPSPWNSKLKETVRNDAYYICFAITS